MNYIMHLIVYLCICMKLQTSLKIVGMSQKAFKKFGWMHAIMVFSGFI